MRGQSGRRRGSAYLLVLGTTMLVATLTLSTSLLARLERDSRARSSLQTQAYFNAQIGLDAAFMELARTPRWRDTIATGEWLKSSGVYSVLVRDPVDLNPNRSVDASGNPVNAERYDRLELFVTGTQETAQQLLGVTLNPTPEPLAALQYAVYAAGDLKIDNNAQLVAAGRPIFCKGEFDNQGSLFGNVLCGTERARSGATLVGTRRFATEAEKAAAELPPFATIFDAYKTAATSLGIRTQVNFNIYGPVIPSLGFRTNSEAIYYISTGGNNLTISNCEIFGSLVIDAGTGTVTLGNQVCLRRAYNVSNPGGIPDSLSLPTLLVKGKLTIDFNQSQLYGSATSSGGSDPATQVPNELDGLIHCSGDLKIKDSSRIRGTILCDGNVVIDGVNRVRHDSSLVTNRPRHYFVERLSIGGDGIVKLTQ